MFFLLASKQSTDVHGMTVNEEHMSKQKGTEGSRGSKNGNDGHNLRDKNQRAQKEDDGFQRTSQDGGVSQDGHKHEAPQYKLCSELMDKVLQLADPMKDEILRNGEEVRLGFGHFSKKVKDAAVREGMITGDHGQPCIPAFKIDMNSLFGYWAKNLRPQRSARRRASRRGLDQP